MDTSRIKGVDVSIIQTYEKIRIIRAAIWAVNFQNVYLLGS